MLKKRYIKTKNEVEVTFEHSAPAEQVALVCESNGWQPVEMKKSKGNIFQAKVRLPIDNRFQYLYLVNGQEWVADESADAYAPNEYGRQNSVVETYSVN